MEDGLHIAVEATMRFFERELGIEAKLNLSANVFERDRVLAKRYAKARIERRVVIVAPLVDAHLLAGQRHGRGGPDRDVLALAVKVDGNRGLVAMGDGPDDVL